MDAQTLTDSQLRGFSITERVCSVFSLLGSILVISTFCASKSFHKPINRLVFYASFGNMMTNVATLMARSYIDRPQSPGCQFQAFLIQMFMPADAFWTLAMAINVYLTFYCKFDAQKLRRMETPYLVCCYGVPFVVAIAYVFVDDRRRGRMYGNATLWCWVSSSWDVWRIATFYVPVWVVILVTFFIYIRAGREIYHKHKQLRDFQYSSSHQDSDPLPPASDLYGATKTTEVVVTTEIVDRQPGQQDIDLAPLGRRRTSVMIAGNVMAAGAKRVDPDGRAAACVVTISSDRQPDVVDDAAADDVIVRTTTTATATTAIRNPASQRMHRRAAYEANSAAWSYAKCALLFFTALLVTWIPSSANRVYSVVHVDQVSVSLEYMSAFVLPLQGFWNAIIYVVTSWKAVCTLWDDVVAEAQGSRWNCWLRGAQRSNRQQHHPGEREKQKRLHTDIRLVRVDVNAAQIRTPGAGSSRDSDEMLVRTVGSHYAADGDADGDGSASSRGRSEQSYESESVKEFAVVRTISRDS